MKLSFSKPFHNNFNHAFTANIDEVMKFYNPDDKTFNPIHAGRGEADPPPKVFPS